MSKFDLRPYVEQDVLDLLKGGDSYDKKFAEAIESGEFEPAEWANGYLKFALLLSISLRSKAPSIISAAER